MCSAQAGGTYSFAYGSTSLKSTPADSSQPLPQLTTSSGSHPTLGAYDELSLGVAAGELAVQYFAGLDAFVFARRPRPASRSSSSSSPGASSDPEGGGGGGGPTLAAQVSISTRILG